MEESHNWLASRHAITEERLFAKMLIASWWVEFRTLSKADVRREMAEAMIQSHPLNPFPLNPGVHIPCALQASLLGGSLRLSGSPFSSIKWADPAMGGFEKWGTWGFEASAFLATLMMVMSVLFAEAGSL